MPAPLVILRSRTMEYYIYSSQGSQSTKTITTLFLTGIISGLGYAVYSNQENGLGRSDIDVREKRKRRAMILETKKSARTENMIKDVLAGRQQIIDKEYLRNCYLITCTLCLPESAGTVLPSVAVAL